MSAAPLGLERLLSGHALVSDGAPEDWTYQMQLDTAICGQRTRDRNSRPTASLLLWSASFASIFCCLRCRMAGEFHFGVVTCDTCSIA